MKNGFSPAGLRNRLRDSDQRGLLFVAPAQVLLNLTDKTKIRGSMPKALGFQDDSDYINLLSGITRREIGLFAKNTWELVMGLL